MGGSSPFNKKGLTSTLLFTSKEWVNLSSLAVPLWLSRYICSSYITSPLLLQHRASKDHWHLLFTMLLHCTPNARQVVATGCTSFIRHTPNTRLVVALHGSHPRLQTTVSDQGNDSRLTPSTKLQASVYNSHPPTITITHYALALPKPSAKSLIFRWSLNLIQYPTQFVNIFFISQAAVPSEKLIKKKRFKTVSIRTGESMNTQANN